MNSCSAEYFCSRSQDDEHYAKLILVWQWAHKLVRFTYGLRSFTGNVDWILCVSFAWISGGQSAAVMHQSLVVVSKLLNLPALLFVTKDW